MYSRSLVTLLLTSLLSVSALPTVSLLSGILEEPSLGRNVAGSNPGVTLPLARRVNSTGSANVLKFDQARAQALRQRAQANGDPGSTSTPDVFDEQAVSQIVSYVVTVQIGTPPTPYNLLVDTGSSNTWVGAGKPWSPSFSTVPTGDVVSVTYGSGAFMGVEILETVTLADGLTIPNQSIGVAIFSEGFDGVDGILGIGPQELTCGSIQDNSNQSIPTVTDVAWDMGLLDSYQVGIAFRPSDSTETKTGMLTFGGVDDSKFTGPLNFFPLTTTKPASSYVGIDQSISYGRQSAVLHPTAGILDTGTTLILLATDAFQRYQAFTGGVPDAKVGLLRITREQYDNLQSLYFHIGGVEYELTPNAQIWPRTLNADIGGNSDAIYLIVNDFGSNSGRGLDFINGMAFLERFYMVYDVGDSRAGLATTQYTDALSN